MKHADVAFVIDFFATCMGRLDRNVEKAEARVNIGYKKPSDYLRHASITFASRLKRSAAGVPGLGGLSK